MLKQCGFVYEDAVLFKKLTAWPLTIWEDVPFMVASSASIDIRII